MLWSLIPFVPVLLVVTTACALLLTGSVRRGPDSRRAGAMAVFGVSGALVASIALWGRDSGGPAALMVDDYTLFFNVLLCVLALVTLSVMPAPHGPGRLTQADASDHALMLLSLAGMMLVAASRDLLILVLAVEASWLGVVGLTGLGRTSEAGAEAAFKALMLGAFASAFALYGVALLYGVTGTTRLDVLTVRVAALSLDPNLLVLIAMGLVLTGFTFLMSAVPFHMWTPDVASGADPAVAGFVTTGIRAAGVAAGVRVLLTSFEPLRTEWLPVMSAMAGITMIVGAIVAAGQSNIRRLIASVGVAQAGCLLVGLLAASPTGKAAVLFALAAWGLATVSAFGVIAAISRSDQPYEEVRDFSGLGRERPRAAALLTICLLSLAGLPPTAGLAAKWFVFGAAVQEGFIALAILGALTGVVLAFACCRVIVQMYLVEGTALTRRPDLSGRTVAAVIVAAAGLVCTGLLPGPLLAAALRSVASVF
jgi:NADH-quinone oxidoreductase subunit N